VTPIHSRRDCPNAVSAAVRVGGLGTLEIDMADATPASGRNSLVQMAAGPVIKL
jgi:hypothetical protein